MIDLEGDPAAVPADIEIGNIPDLLVDQRLEQGCLQIDHAQPLDVTAIIGRGPEPAVRCEFQPVIADRIAAVGQLAHRASREIDHIELIVADRDIVEDQELLVIRRKVDRKPAAAGRCDQHFCAVRIGRVHQVDVVVQPGALVRAKGDQLAAARPGAETVAALAVGEQPGLAVCKRVNLVDLVAAAVFLEQQSRAIGRIASGIDRFAGKGQLFALAPGRGDAVQLAGVAKAGRDQHRFCLRVPVDKAGRPIFHIGAGALDHRERNRGNLVGDKRGWPGRGILGQCYSGHCDCRCCRH